jgi:hypothetical protein
MHALNICMPLFMHRTNILTPTLLVATAWAAQAAVSFTGSPYTQNFDTLPNAPVNTSLQSTAPWTDDVASPSGQSSILGWYLWHPLESTSEGGANDHQRLRVQNGTQNAGAFYSFGASGATDRALGGLSSTTLVTGGTESYIGLRLHNDTGSTLSSFSLSYTGEQWRDGGAASPNAQSLTFGYSTTATSVEDASFTSVAALNFTSPVFVNTGSGAAVDGNVAGKVVISAVTVDGLTWAPGTDLWLRWTDKNDGGNDHGLAIDDLTFTAVVPEPGSAALIGLGVLAFGLLRRKNK